MELRVRVKIVKDGLIIGELVVPFLRPHVAEVVPKLHHQHVASEQLSLFAVLIQQHMGPGQMMGYNNGSTHTHTHIN